MLCRIPPKRVSLSKFSAAFGVFAEFRQKTDCPGPLQLLVASTDWSIPALQRSFMRIPGVFRRKVSPAKTEKGLWKVLLKGLWGSVLHQPLGDQQLSAAAEGLTPQTKNSKLAFQRRSCTTTPRRCGTMRLHQRPPPPAPFVRRRSILNLPTPMVDRGQPDSRRSKPSSRTPLMDEQSNPWNLLQLQDGVSRHRGAKRGRR